MALSHIREVDAIIHLVRCFESEKIQHVSKKIDPINDLETIKTEILLADINQIEKKLQKNIKKKMTDKQIKFLEDILKKLNDGKNLSVYNRIEDIKLLKETGLISVKPSIIVCNVDEKNVKNGNDYTDVLKTRYPNEKFIIICADIEDQITDLKPEERESYMKHRFRKTGLNRLIKLYDLLNLNTFFIWSGRVQSMDDKKRYSGSKSSWCYTY